MNRSPEKQLQEINERKKALFAEAYGFERLVGQHDLVERLKRFGEFYAARTGVPERVLIAGNGGMGKRTFARAFAKVFNTAITETDARDSMSSAYLKRFIAVSAGIVYARG